MQDSPPRDEPVVPRRRTVNVTRTERAGRILLGATRATGGHGWMMIACCVPMLAIAIALVATGVVNSGFLIAAVVCTVMMALMMRGMGNDENGM